MTQPQANSGFMERVTPLVLTCNEAANIGRTLGQLTSFPNVLVLDSFSNDETVAIARSYPNVRLAQRAFDTHAAQWNFAVDSADTPWVLTLDADYQLSAPLLESIKNLTPPDGTKVFFARFQMCIHGRVLRSSVYPPRPVLFHRDSARYYDDGHTQRLRYRGTCETLPGIIYHDDRKPLSRWVSDQDRYAKIEAIHLLARPNKQLNFQDRLRRRLFFAPPIIFLYLLIGRGLIFDGWPGWFYVLQRTVAETLLSLRLIVQRNSLEKNGK